MLKLGAAKKEAGRAWSLVDIRVPETDEELTVNGFSFRLRRDRLRRVTSMTQQVTAPPIEVRKGSELPFTHRSGCNPLWRSGFPKIADAQAMRVSTARRRFARHTRRIVFCKSLDLMNGGYRVLDVGG